MLTCLKIFVYLTNKAKPLYLLIWSTRLIFSMSLEVSYFRKENPVSTFLHNLPVESVNMSETISASQRVETGTTIENNTNSYQPRYAKGFKIVFWLKIEEGFVVL